MSGDLDLDQLRELIRERGAQWTAGETSESRRGTREASNRLGYIPGPNDPSLDQAEERSRDAAARPASRAAAVGAPPKYDWRDVDGQNFITPVTDQSTCGSCVAFGTIAAMEALVRIDAKNPDLAVDLSEAHLFFCYGPDGGAGRCPSGGWYPDAALDAVLNGVVDEECFPYTPDDQECNLCPDAQSRLTKITGWHRIEDPAEMKAFLSTTGPLTGGFAVYEDFNYYTGGIYKHVTGSRRGGHCICIVGYDDTDGCWIVKNSWGPNWGEGGYFRIAYGECGIDALMWAPEGVTTPSL